ncbi:hypothetical protein CF161_12731 [Pseudomonas sp. CF161]|nr:hypothetical protein CF161_12731 [Pseudomonas sp. CF161]
MTAASSMKWFITVRPAAICLSGTAYEKRKVVINVIKKTTCALAVLAITSGTAIAESIDVKVIGTIKPPACTPTLAGGGTLDYGTILPNTLSDDAFTVLEEKQVEFSITCDAAAKVALNAKTGRALSAVDNDGTLVDISAPGVAIFGNPDMRAYGLGLAGTKGVGGYGLRLATGTMTADTQSVDSLYSDDATLTWVKGITGSLISTTARTFSWAKTGTLEPISFTTLSGKLGVQAYINKKSELDLTKPVQLDGLATLELVYL